jgi:hypothetical protein
MNATNRILNRGLLLVVGIVLLAAGAAAMVTGLRPAWLGPWPERVTEAAHALGGIDVAGAGTVPVLLVWALGVALLCAVLLVVFVFTRGRGKTKNVLRVEADGGRTVVDRNVAEALLAGTLAERPDVLSARTGAYLVRGTRAVELSVTVQRGASLSRVLAAAESAVQDWDALLGERIPVLVHLSDRTWRDRLRPRARVR